MGVRPGARQPRHRDAQAPQQPQHMPRVALEGTVLTEYLQPSGKPFAFATSPYLVSLPTAKGAGAGTFALEQPQLAWSR